jgi:hypothetical protein
MNQPFRSGKIPRLVTALLGFLYTLSGLHKLLGIESFGFGDPRPILDPVHSLDDEWKSTYCDCSIKVTERDLTLF